MQNDSRIKTVWEETYKKYIRTEKLQKQKYQEVVIENTQTQNKNPSNGNPRKNGNIQHERNEIITIIEEYYEELYEYKKHVLKTHQ